MTQMDCVTSLPVVEVTLYWHRLGTAALKTDPLDFLS